MVRFGTGILPEAEREHLRTELGWLSGQTSLGRDLDVHLIGLDEMAGAVADPGALTPFAVLLGEQREQAHRELEAALSSPRFEALVAGCAAGRSPRTHRRRTCTTCASARRSCAT